MRLPHVVTLLSIMATLAHPAAAQTQWCEGSANRIFADIEGKVFILASYRNDWTMICSLTSGWKGVSTETCKTWYATALSAVLSGKQVTLMYWDVPSCSTIPSYTDAPAPAYVLIAR
jgi:hypothetical protein